MAWHKSHKWILKPFTSYEIFRELRVRESKHTVMVWDKKYYDSDSGKLITDKIKTINSYHISDMIDDYAHDHMVYDKYPEYRIKNRQIKEEENSRIFNIPKFIPKDNDFDKECELEEIKELEDKKETKINGCYIIKNCWIPK